MATTKKFIVSVEVKCEGKNETTEILNINKAVNAILNKGEKILNEIQGFEATISILDVDGRHLKLISKDK